MKLEIRLAGTLLLAGWLVPGVALAQTLTITNGIQTCTALTNTTVTMSGNSELHLTAANNPIPGCVINLNSAGAWVQLPNLRPSVVSNLLSQFVVNGTAAVYNSNVRVVEYAMGTYVIPHSPGITPLQLFTGPEFLGASTNLGLYTYYNTSAALGVFNQNIGSFILKRGYMATMAQNPNGTGASQVFVAQDGDLNVGFLPATLNQPIAFVRVFPWRWTAKKGWGGSTFIANTAPLWWYDWGNSPNSAEESAAGSPLDREYLPMKWSSSSGVSSINSLQNTTCVLGYNEPDSTSQANMTTTQALADWPNLMQWGLRAGAPASSDSGEGGQGTEWTDAFMDLVTNAGYRVDFIPVHWYKCGQTPQQLTNYLGAVYAQFKLPMWVTEWNDGASWCTPLPGSEAADATSISNFVAALENCPFVERYSIYEYFDPSTYLNLVTTNTPAALTPAGVMYLNLPSKVAYTQVMPAGGSRGIAQFHFETNTLDSSGYGNHGFAVGDPNYVTGVVGQAVALDGTNSYLQLPPSLGQSNTFTFAGWVCWNGGASGQHMFDFGNDPTHYFYLTPSSSSGTLRYAICNGGSVVTLDTVTLPVGQWEHVALTLSGNTATIYTNGVLAAASSSIVYTPATIKPVRNYLGKSQSGTDPLFNGQLDEVEIADTAFTAAQIAALPTNPAPQFVTSLLTSVSSTQTMAFTSSIAGTATDPNPGDTLTYSKISGPAWLNVAANGALTGTPTPTDGGTNIFIVQVVDTAGASAFAGLSLITIPFNANGVWNVDASGNWSTTNNWNGGAVGSGAGFTADFSTVNLTANRKVTLDVSRSIGTLRFGNPSGTQSWTLAPNGATVLTFNSGTAASPTVAVNQNTATLAPPLAGTAGLTKTGPGTLTLTGVNTYTGPTIISGGGLTLGSASQLAGGAYAQNITDNGAFNDNSSAAQTFSGVISGSGSLTQSTGALTLSGYNTYTGGTTLNGGTLTLAVGGGTGAIRDNLTINAGATVNLTAGDALGYTAGSPAVYVTTVNLNGGVLNIGVNGNEAYSTAFHLSGGTLSSSGGGAYNFDGTTGASINSLLNTTVSTISAGVILRNTGMVIATAPGAVPGGVDLNITGVIGEQYGSFGFTKSGAGTLLLSAVNTNSGATIVSAGTLLVKGAITSTASVTVADTATLGGSGVINGPVTIQSGGTLAPGAGATSVSTLTVSNSVTLQAGSVTRMSVSQMPRANDVLRVAGAAGGLNYGGTLLVTNLAGTLAAGDTFKLFNAAGYSGGFTTLLLPAPGSGLVWSTANLAVNGTLSVIAVPAPQFTTLAPQPNGSLQFSGLGTAGITYELDATSNLFPPILWLMVTNAAANQTGLVQFVDFQATNFLQRFYRMKAGP